MRDGESEGERPRTTSSLRRPPSDIGRAGAPLPPPPTRPSPPDDAIAGRHANDRPARRRILDSPAAMLALIALAIGVLAGGLTAYYEFTRPTTYRSTAVLLIDQANAIASSQDDGVVNKLSRLRVKYVGIAQTLVFDQPVAAQAGLPVGTVHQALAPSFDAASLLVRIAATMPRPADARRLAEVAAQQLVTYTQEEQNAAGIASKDAVTFTIVSPATSAQRVTPDRQRAALVGVFVFFAITIVGLLGADLLRRRQQRRIV
jgi:capsular polysaccharide biosynthesis protein